MTLEMSVEEAEFLAASDPLGEAREGVLSADLAGGA
jgi:hypothetical protein